MKCYDVDVARKVDFYLKFRITGTYGNFVLLFCRLLIFLIFCRFFVLRFDIPFLQLQLFIDEVQYKGLVLRVEAEHGKHEVQVTVGPVLVPHMALEHLILVCREDALAQTALDHTRR